MPRSRAIAAALLLALSGTPASAADCLKPMTPDAAAAGKLVIRDDAFILEMKDGICLAGPGEWDNADRTRRIHVSAETEKMIETLRGFVGKRVEIRGEMFARHTVHHMEPIVMMATAVSEQP